MYCFYRKNLNGNPTLKETIDYFNAVFDNSSRIRNLNSYQVFEEEFLSGRISVEIHKLNGNSG